MKVSTEEDGEKSDPLFRFQQQLNESGVSISVCPPTETGPSASAWGMAVVYDADPTPW